MAVKHLKAGEDFSAEHFAGSGFGFSGSAGPKKSAPKKSGKAVKEPAGVMLVIGVPHHEPTAKARASHPTIEDHADGSRTSHFQDGRRVMHRADGGMVTHHPDGRVEHCYADGGHVTHHPSGLVTHHHADGGMEHRHPDGRIVQHHADGTVEEHDASEFAHRRPKAKNADPDEAQDRKMVETGIHQHEDQEHEGHHSELHLARGGHVRVSLPRNMKPKAERIRTPIGNVNRAPKNPISIPTPRNAMPGGQAPYGVEPSAEPDDAGSDQTGISQMAHGGKVRKRR